MDIEIVQPSYRCKEQQVLNIAIKGWQLYMTHFVPFKNFSHFYTEDKAIEQLALVKEIENTYFHKPEKLEFHDLVDQTKLLCQKWQVLKRYIQGAYPKRYHRSKLISAGKSYYFTAYRLNYEDVNLLIEQSTIFLQNYKVILLLDNNMPVGFEEEYSATCEQFREQFLLYKTKKAANKQVKYKKIQALNKLYKPLVEMLNDAKAIFVNEKNILKKFSFADLLLQHKD